MHPPLKYNKQVSLKVPQGFRLEKQYPLKPYRVCTQELLTGLKYLQHKFVCSALSSISWA